MKKGKRNKGRKSVNRKPKGIMALIIVLGMAITLLFGIRTVRNINAYSRRMDALRHEVFAKEVAQNMEETPAGQVGNVVFISICDTANRAQVFTGTGIGLEDAWEAANKKAKKAVIGGLNPVWVKADVVISSEEVQAVEFNESIRLSVEEFYKDGVSFDPDFKTALLEGELNGAKIFNYEDGGIDYEYLNLYLAENGRRQLTQIPSSFITFRCKGWMCDESNVVHELSSEERDYGWRIVDQVDGEYAKWMVVNAAEFLRNLIQKDGSFIYGYHPRFDRELVGYNIIRHAGTVWSMICSYHMEPNPELEAGIKRAIDYMLTQVIYDDDGRGFLYDSDENLVFVGGNGLAVVALTEYAEVFQSDAYEKECLALGEGILAMMDQESGVYYHVYNKDLTLNKEFRTVYYDGESTFALCRLYGMTGAEKWLDAAKAAVDRFIREDYTQYKDHWVSYSMNEITKYVPDNAEYYSFAMKNVQENLMKMICREDIVPTNLELLMAAFETYERAIKHGMPLDGFDSEAFFDGIRTLVEHHRTAYFYPEYAMYMKDPKSIVDTFMMRDEGFRTRIDDVQHNIGGYYLYWKNSEQLMALGGGG